MKEEHREAALKLRAAQLKEGHLLNSRKSYRGWMIRYRDARLEKRCRDVQGFLDLLIHGEKYVAPPTIHQAVNALVFYHKHVLGRPIPPDSLKFPRRSRHKSQRDCPTHQEVMDIFSHMRGLPLLQAEMLYGTSGRITALLTLRMKDLDLVRGNVSFRFDKGGKSRTLPLPRTLLPKLHARFGGPLESRGKGVAA